MTQWENQLFVLFWNCILNCRLRSTQWGSIWVRQCTEWCGVTFSPKKNSIHKNGRFGKYQYFSNTFDSDFFLNCWTKYSLSSLKYLKDVWKVSTIVGSKRVKKTTSLPETTETSTKSTREFDASGKASTLTAASITADPSARGESSRVSSTAKKNFLFSEISCLKLLDVLTRL